MLILFNKPYHCLSQFTDTEGRQTLADFIPEKNYYPAGRLDYDSEGLLILTRHGKWQQQISDPKFHLEKTYLAQVEGTPSKAAIKQLCEGVMLKDGMTRPAKVSRTSVKLWQRHPPIRSRQNIPTAWLKLTISEGRNRQVRRMLAAVDLPCLRLVRLAIGPWHLGQLAVGQYQFVPYKNPQQNG